MCPQDDAHLLPHSDTERKLLFCPAHFYLIDPRDFNYWKETLEQRVFIYLFRSPHGHYIGWKADIPVTQGSRGKINVGVCMGEWKHLEQ